MSKAQKLNRKDLRTPDTYQVRVASMASWLAERRTPVLMVVLAILLGGIGTAAVAYNQQRRNAVLSYELSKAVNLYAEAIDMAPDAEGRAKKLDEARQALLKLYDEAVDTDIHSFVLTYLANIYVEGKNYPEAIGVLLQLQKELQNDPDRLAIALYQLAKVYAAQYQPDEAMKVLEKALTLEPNSIRDVIREEIKRLSMGSLSKELTTQLRLQATKPPSDKKGTADDASAPKDGTPTPPKSK